MKDRKLKQILKKADEIIETIDVPDMSSKIKQLVSKVNLTQKNTENKNSVKVKQAAVKRARLWLSISAVCIAAIFFTAGFFLPGLIREQDHQAVEVSKYQANSYSVANPDNQGERIKYSYSYGSYNFYYIYLGQLKNIPLYYTTPEYHTGVNGTLAFSLSENETKTIENIIYDSSEKARDIIAENTISNGKKVSDIVESTFDMGFVDLIAKNKGEAAFNKYASNISQKQGSLTNTVDEGAFITREYYSKALKGEAKQFNLTRDDKVGFYRYTLFSSSDVYLYIITNPEGEVGFYEFKEHMVPNSDFWMLDYSENNFSEKSATKFEVDLSILDSLKHSKPALTLNDIPEEPDYAVYTSLAGLASDFDNNNVIKSEVLVSFEDSTDLIGSDNKTINIPVHIGVLSIKGIAGHTFTDVSFAVAPRTTKLTLNFFDFSFTAPSSTIAINANCDLDLNLTGSCNIKGGTGVTSSSSNTSKQPGGIGISAKNLIITGDGELKVYGGNGGAGSGTTQGMKYYGVGHYEYVTVGMRGGNGGVGIQCSNLTLDIKSLTIAGGSGGNGNIGYVGSRGGSGAYGVSASSMKNLNNSAVIVTGGNGGNGKNLFYSTDGGSSVNLGGGGYGASAVTTSDTTGNITKTSGTNGISYN